MLLLTDKFKHGAYNKRNLHNKAHMNTIYLKLILPIEAHTMMHYIVKCT